MVAHQNIAEWVQQAEEVHLMVLFPERKNVKVMHFRSSMNLIFDSWFCFFGNATQENISWLQLLSSSLENKTEQMIFVVKANYFRHSATICSGNFACVIRLQVSAKARIVLFVSRCQPVSAKLSRSSEIKY